MTEWALLAPGPSASAAILPDGMSLGVVGNAFQLVDRAEFLAATDAAWWGKHPEAFKFNGRKFSILQHRGVERLQIAPCNSGVLALECAKRLGATRIRLYGFDMHGSHFFGPYTNGLSNTTDQKRVVHLRQFRNWARENPGIDVVNCTPGSAIQCFRFEGECHADAA